jgi:primosomal protein N' (replication factor Y)
MHILDVIPLARGINKDLLSYFAPNATAPGTIVTVPLRGKTVFALVVASRPAEDARLELKNAAFTYKKIHGVSSEHLLSHEFMRATKRTADYHAASLGSLLFSVLPNIVLDNIGELTHVAIPPQSSAQLNAKQPEQPEQKFLHGAILQADDEERFFNYRSLVRQEFARGRSVFLCMPTVGDIKRAEKMLEKGIAEYSYTFHGSIKKKDLVSRWNKLATETHPVFIIGTGQFFCVPRRDIGTIIIERESSRVYKSQSRPFTDLRFFAEKYALETNTQIIFADTLLRAETVWRHKNDELGEVMPLSMRVKTAAKTHTIDMRTQVSGRGRFDPISKTIEELIRMSGERGEKLFLFASRRGLSPITICMDCSTVITCKTCNAPIVLHTSTAKHAEKISNSDRERVFVCHRCGETRDAHERCRSCSGWRLHTLGVGIELIAQELAERFPNQTIFRIDSDSVKTNAEAMRIAKSFYEAPGGILLGTEMALTYLGEKIENVGIISMDSMFAVPDFRIREKILSILIRLRSLAEKYFIIQTRNIEESVFEFAEKGNLLEFYKQELDDRAQFDYPPFTTLIKISLSGDKEKVTASMQTIAEAFQDYNISIYPAFTPFARGTYTMHALIKIGRDRWVEPALYEKLRALPPSFSIAVDPDSVL